MTQEELEQRVNNTYDAWQLAISNREDEYTIYIKKCEYEVAKDDLELFLEQNK